MFYGCLFLLTNSCVTRSFVGTANSRGSLFLAWFLFVCFFMFWFTLVLEVLWLRRLVS